MERLFIFRNYDLSYKPMYMDAKQFQFKGKNNRKRFFLEVAADQSLRAKRDWLERWVQQKKRKIVKIDGIKQNKKD